MRSKKRGLLVGGGESLLELASLFLAEQHEVFLAMSSRHANESLKGTRLRDRATSLNLNFTIVEDSRLLGQVVSDFAPSYVIGVGPSWVIPAEILNQCPIWINVNMIPIPDFRGGAHVSWQILTQNHSGSVVFQLITKEVDKGAILGRVDFQYPKHCRYPQDFLDFNVEQLQRAFPHLVAVILRLSEGDTESSLKSAGRSFPDFAGSYFPRLQTSIHGWIDWTWSATELTRFVLAFSYPHSGAQTMIQGSKVRIIDAEIDSFQTMHPFVAGLLLCQQESPTHWLVGCRDGILLLEFGLPIPKLKEGMRLVTPPDKLFLSLNARVSSKQLT